MGFEPTTSAVTGRRSNQLSHQAKLLLYLQNRIRKSFICDLTFPATISFWISLRPISTYQLHMLPCFYLKPIYLVVFKGSYMINMGYLILRGASRLDAFSVYPCRTWLLCHASGDATDTPAVRPPRSSRTKGSSSQISSAYAG